MALIAQLCGQTLREALRSRVVWVGIGWAVIALVTAPTLASVVLGQASRGLIDLLLTSLWLTGCAGAIGVALPLASSDRALLQRARSADLSMSQWAAGRALGLGVVCLGAAGAGALCWAAVALLNGLVPPPELLGWTLLTGLEWWWLALLTRLMRTALPAFPAAAATVALWIVAHLEAPYAALVARSDFGSPVVHHIVYTLLPDLGRLDTVPVLLGSVSWSGRDWAAVVVYALLWCVALTGANLAVATRGVHR